MVAITSTLRAAAAPLRATRRSTIRVGASRRVSVVRAFRDDEIKEAGKDVVDTVSTTANEIVDKVAAYWEASEEKPTLVAVGFGAILALYFANTVVTAVDHLPLFSTVFELIGLTFSGWTTYRLIAVEGEKEKLISQVKGFAKDIGLNL
ncbi:hypothetical protein Ndes2526B_g07891 [Nannochloris sp. 'desiccata']|nr:putative Protein CURVATURE THYLAKOID 1C, chloroplastic [Chlorella desiccata (nom. nud.)]